MGKGKRKNPAAVSLGKKRKAGQTAKQRKEAARKAAAARWSGKKQQQDQPEPSANIY
jgi:hypothetical protein